MASSKNLMTKTLLNSLQPLKRVFIMNTLGSVSRKTLDKVPGFPHDGLTINGVKQKDEN